MADKQPKPKGDKSGKAANDAQRANWQKHR